MVGMGLLMLAVSWTGVWLTRQNRTPGRWLLRTFAGMTFAGWIAVVAGWYTTEMGRQPWLVQGILRTADAAAPNIGSGMIGLSLTLYLTLYALLLAAYVSVLFYLARHADAPAIPERALEQAK